MMKSICVLAHRADSSRADFQDYYERNHAPLAIRHFPFRRYVRNHLMDAPDIGFDTISEFWAEDIGVLGALMDGPAGDILRADEVKFMDQSRIASAGSRELILSPESVADERNALLIDWDGEEDMLTQWVQDVVGHVPGVSIDRVTPWGTPVFPARAVLWLPASIPVPEAPAEFRVRVVRTRRCETPAEELKTAIQGAPG